MIRSCRTYCFALTLLFSFSASVAFAETIELVTYYPSSATVGQVEANRLHAGRATVGDPYSVTNPADAVLPNGTLLVADSVGIGAVFGTTPPAGALHVVGIANQPDRVLFMPGAGGTLNVGIGAANPLGPLHVTGVANQASNVLFMPGAGTGAIRVGIGTAAPSGLLTLQGQDPLYGRFTLFPGGIGPGNYQDVAFDGGSDRVFYFQNKSGATGRTAFLTFDDREGLTIANSGNVGISTATPNAPLHVRSAITTPAPDVLVERNSNLPGSNGSPRIGLVDTWQAGATAATAPAWFIDNVRDNFRVFRQPNISMPGVEMLRVSAVGNVGIGAGVVPGYPLEVINAIYARRQGDGLMVRLGLQNTNRHWSISNYGNQAGLIQGAFVIADETAGLTRLTITTAGRVGIGTNVPTALLSVNGAANKPGAGTWTAFSDRRIKKDIYPYTDGLALIRAVNPVHYKYNGLGPYKDDKINYVGVIAQDIQKIAPYMVDAYKMKLHPEDSEETELLRFDGSALTYALINAVKELKVENDALKQRVETLERKQKE